VLHLTLNALDPECSETGYGVWTDRMDDNEHPILVINATTGQAWFTDPDSIRFDPDTHEVQGSAFASGIMSFQGDLFDFNVVNVRDGVMPTYTDINEGSDEEQDADEDGE
jgi:hypothetical protein